MLVAGKVETMASRQNTIDFIVEQVSRAGHVTARKMFGEYGLYCDGKLVALVCDDQLFVKPTAQGRAFLRWPLEVPPYQGAKPYFLIAGEAWDNAEWLTDLIKQSAAALPAPAPRKAAPKARKQVS